jgi:hypothetical protein
MCSPYSQLAVSRATRCRPSAVRSTASAFSPGVRLIWVDSWRKTLGRELVPVLEVTGHVVPVGL